MSFPLIPTAPILFSNYSEKPTLSPNLARLQAALADRYRVERELGRGGMATVFYAWDLKHDRPVALKLLHSDLAHLLGPERFLREIRLSARLQHLTSSRCSIRATWVGPAIRAEHSSGTPCPSSRARPFATAYGEKGNSCWMRLCGLPARRRMPCTTLTSTE